MFFSQQVFNEIATSEYFFDSSSIWKIYLGLSTPNEMFKWQKKKIIFFEMADWPIS